MEELLHIENFYAFKMIPDADRIPQLVIPFSTQELHDYKLENCMRNKR